MRDASDRQKRKSTREDDGRAVKKQHSSQLKETKPGNTHHLESINVNIASGQNLPAVDVAVTDVSASLMDKLESTVMNMNSDDKQHRPSSTIDVAVTEASVALVDQIESMATENISSDEELDGVQHASTQNVDDTVEENESMVVNIGSDEEGGPRSVAVVSSDTSVERMSGAEASKTSAEEDNKQAAAAGDDDDDRKEIKLVADDVPDAEFKQEKSKCDEESKEEGIVNISSDEEEDVHDLTVTKALESIAENISSEDDDEETMQCTSVEIRKDGSTVVNVSSDDDELGDLSSSYAAEEKHPDDDLQGANECIVHEKDDEHGPDILLKQEYDSVHLEHSEGTVQPEGMTIEGNKDKKDVAGLSIAEVLETMAENISSDEEENGSGDEEDDGRNSQLDSMIVNVSSDENKDDLDSLAADVTLSDMPVEAMDKEMSSGDAAELASDELTEIVVDEGEGGMSDAVMEWLQSLAAAKQSPDDEAPDIYPSSLTEEASDPADPDISGEKTDPGISSMLPVPEALESVSNDSTLSLESSEMAKVCGDNVESFTAAAECDKEIEYGEMSMETEAEGTENLSGEFEISFDDQQDLAVTNSELVSSDIIGQELAVEALPSSTSEHVIDPFAAANADLEVLECIAENFSLAEETIQSEHIAENISSDEETEQNNESGENIALDVPDVAAAANDDDEDVVDDDDVEIDLL